MIVLKLDKPLNCQYIADIMKSLVHEIPEDDRHNSNEYVIVMNITKPTEYLEISKITHEDIEK